ncbi:MAG: histidine kinase [Prolixibacteraceae bacterium]|nr:histidine kinase [Prolixibacteraceae bacterium]
MKRRNIILIHILYWFYILNQLLFPLYVGMPESTTVVENEYMMDVIISLLLNVIVFYAVYAAFPVIFSMKNKLLITGTLILIVLILIGIRLPISWYFWKYIGYPPEHEMKFEWVWVWNELRMVVITGIYSVLIRFMIKMFETQKLKNELIHQRQASELALLRSQINPHFLFNTLNNIYSLVYHKSAEAPEAVMKFSSIMRYVLYDAPSEKVLLEKEIEYLRSYIELQELRFKKTGLVSLNIEGATEGITIAPMLLITFVENAFKHGCKNRQPGIVITLKMENGDIRFEVCNYINRNKKTLEELYSGIGLSNLKRRLELIYAGKYNLDINEDNDQFKVNLIIRK